MSIDLINSFNTKIAQKNINWEVKGLISANGNIFTLGSDSKLIGRIFELIVTPVLNEIADENGYKLVASDQQTVYPDFTMLRSEDDTDKIAIDIKTTYRRFNKNGELKKFGYTLGSFASFMRNNTKNIMYPYDTYSKHYVIGFLYSRNDYAIEGQMVNSADLNTIPTPYSDVEFFVQEKYKIAGDKPGSGNTENMGSFGTTDINELRLGNGPFSVLGKDIYEDYWRNYPKYRENNNSFNSLDTYFDWLVKQGRASEQARQLYNQWKSR
jgi:hypothetical protein